MKALLDAGADLEARAEGSYTPLHFAETAEVVTALLKAGADASAAPLDTQYRYNGGPVQTLLGWPVLSNGQASPCVQAGVRAPGSYQYVGIRNSLDPTAPWVPVDVTVVVE